MLITKTILIIVGLYLLVILFMYLNQERLIFYPTTLPSDYPFSEYSNIEELYFTSPDGAIIHALHFQKDNPKGIVLYFHGNARGLEDWGHAAHDFTSRGYEVLMQDYRTYGKSKGQLSEKAFHEDAMLLYQHLLKTNAEKDIILYGRSLGSGVACALGTQTNPRMVILETPYLSLLEMAGGKLSFIPTKWLLKYEFRNDLNIKKIKAPVYLFHGTNDELIPYQHAVELEKIYGKKILFTIPNGGHNNLGDFAAFQEGLTEVLGR